ncbi:primosomal protein N' [Clostridium sp. JN-9]|uniref:primosomal protein N' n=1 Tax=Clostridium sp. JN-9 TaxID=2507159 RepID=UPI000FFDFAC4|nr:primosomal protein N' [Clostridium sp. JN-9]QAT40143.1 primosomal protein N' [Clostridium sp. JN-9]
MYKYAGIVINNDAAALDRIFTYEIPEKFQNIIRIGHRVKVPFGNGNIKIYGIVFQLFNDVKLENADKIKRIIEISDDFPILRDTDITLINAMKRKYLCTRIQCIKAVVPSTIFKDIKSKVEMVVTVGKSPEGRYKNDTYMSIYNIVKNNNGIYNRSELKEKFNLSLSSINTMIKHGYLLLRSMIINRYNDRIYNKYSRKILNPQQQTAVETILNSDYNKFLIHGITGSGKTEVYMSLVSEMIKKGKDSIILVPEISLTPQMVERFKGRFGKDISVFHSKLSDGERYDEWLRIKEGKVKVAIGARSAVFLPFNNLGMIVIDEEHENSYKSDSDPKYNAREIAEMKCDIEQCKLVLGSATPSIETFYRSRKNEFRYICLDKRVDGVEMPDIKIVDLRQELLKNNRSIFSEDLFNGIKEKLSKNEQIILFLNRRGFSTFVSCRKCGFVFKCDNCDISLTYHANEKSLVCHYCGKKINVPKVCPKCGSNYVKYFGIGTEKIEMEVKKYFPQARTLRMDFDTTRKKNSYENIYNSFKNHEADILIGTQMIAKGLDFENVTLVGVLAADLSLNMPDYTSSERTFQLLTQVSGRAGRGKKKGEVIIQTYSPEDKSIQCAARNDYMSFYENEISLRKSMDYPPFSQILLLNFASKNENLLIKCIQNVGIILKNAIIKYDKILMLGPCPCEISKIKENYRWQIILKGQIDNELAEGIKNLTYKSLQGSKNEIRVSLDMNPNSLL